MTISYDADGTPRGSVDDVERLMAEANGPLGSTVNGMRWDTDECAIVDLLWAHGIVMNDDGYAVLADEQDDEDELVGWCPECHCERTFVILPDSEIEGDIDPDWIYWACVMCQTAPGDPPEPAPYVKPPVIMHDDPSWPTPRPADEWMMRTRHRCVPSCRVEAS